MPYNPEKHLYQKRTKEVILKADGEEFPITVTVDWKGNPSLPWALQNQITMLHLKWDAQGGTTFNVDGYIRDCLKHLIIEAPWGVTTDAFLLQVGSELGTALSALVPVAFPNKGPDIETVKKG